MLKYGLLALHATILLIWCDGSVAAEPDGKEMSERIDRAIQGELDRVKIPASPTADDAQFLRRVTLDLTGRIPTPEQTVAFLDSTDKEKRRKLIDELLSNPRYGEYLAGRWIDIVVANGTPPRSTIGLFREWPAKQFNEGRGWDQIVKEMLTADGLPGESPASWFLRANLREPGKRADTTARYFLGVQVQCAECHNHPFTEWKQGDYTRCGAG